MKQKKSLHFSVQSDILRRVCWLFFPFSPLIFLFFLIILAVLSENHAVKGCKEKPAAIPDRGGGDRWSHGSRHKPKKRCKHCSARALRHIWWADACATVCWGLSRTTGTLPPPPCRRKPPVFSPPYPLSAREKNTELFWCSFPAYRWKSPPSGWMVHTLTTAGRKPCGSPAACGRIWQGVISQSMRWRGTGN